MVQLLTKQTRKTGSEEDGTLALLSGHFHVVT
jgi:hypothetical protein